MDPPISQCNSPCNEFTSGQCLYTIPDTVFRDIEANVKMLTNRQTN